MKVNVLALVPIHQIGALPSRHVVDQLLVSTSISRREAGMQELLELVDELAGLEAVVGRVRVGSGALAVVDGVARGVHAQGMTRCVSGGRPESS